uniref:Uncharacterized protein n=1 Tax=Arundo donax TaxID=35708 RepID=A0A0A9CP22_ARUDO
MALAVPYAGLRCICIAKHLECPVCFVGMLRVPTLALLNDYIFLPHFTSRKGILQDILSH